MPRCLPHATATAGSHRATSLLLACVLVALGLLTLPPELAAQERAQARLATVALSAGMHRIEAEVAHTDEQKRIGLMHRRQLGANEGMLFVYQRPAVQCFWMRNTVLPLTIAFLDDDGRIVNLADMQPLDETGKHCSAKPVRLALEMNQGWFDRRGLKPGVKLRGAPFGTPAAR